MRTESFMSKLHNKLQAARATIGKIFERKQAARPQLPLGPASTTTLPDITLTGKDNTVPVVPSKIRIGPSYTAPKPSPATLIQRRQKKARRIQRRAA